MGIGTTCHSVMTDSTVAIARDIYFAPQHTFRRKTLRTAAVHRAFSQTIDHDIGYLAIANINARVFHRNP